MPWWRLPLLREQAYRHNIIILSRPPLLIVRRLPLILCFLLTLIDLQPIHMFMHLPQGPHLVIAVRPPTFVVVR
jgi:hypothetical protein